MSAISNGPHFGALYAEEQPLAIARPLLIRALVGHGLEKFGEFALFWNQDLDSVVRRRNNRGAALRRHVEMVCKSLQGCLPRRELTSEMLLPEGSEERIDTGFIGVLGAFEVYRGKARGHRMANLRLILR